MLIITFISYVLAACLKQSEYISCTTTASLAIASCSQQVYLAWTRSKMYLLLRTTVVFVRGIFSWISALIYVRTTSSCSCRRNRLEIHKTLPIVKPSVRWWQWIKNLIRRQEQRHLELIQFPQILCFDQIQWRSHHEYLALKLLLQPLYRVEMESIPVILFHLGGSMIVVLN